MSSGRLPAPTRARLLALGAEETAEKAIAVGTLPRSWAGVRKVVPMGAPSRAGETRCAMAGDLEAPRAFAGRQFRSYGCPTETWVAVPTWTNGRSGPPAKDPFGRPSPA